MAESPDLTRAATLALSRFRPPVLTQYSLGTLVYHLCAAGRIDGLKLPMGRQPPERRHFQQVMDFLVEYGVATRVRGFPDKSVLTLIGRPDPSPQEIACTIDPFAYLSHLSAMEFHGLTDRFPRDIYLTTPAPAAWRKFADERMAKDLGDHLSAYLEAGFPRLQRIRMNKILDRSVHVTHSLHLGAYKSVPSAELRVATIGRTFLEMLREPDLCGGIRHVIDIYRQRAGRYVTLIASEVDRHGTAIDKARAGYILEELCDIRSPQIQEWARHAQRGGSRKLYAKGEYSPKFSERWCLSLNVD